MHPIFTISKNSGTFNNPRMRSASPVIDADALGGRLANPINDTMRGSRRSMSVDAGQPSSLEGIVMCRSGHPLVQEHPQAPGCLLSRRGELLVLMPAMTHKSVRWPSAKSRNSFLIGRLVVSKSSIQTSDTSAAGSPCPDWRPQLRFPRVTEGAARAEWWPSLRLVSRPRAPG